jgi:hypothetical protein
LKILWVCVNGDPLPLATRVQTIQNVVEDFVERNAAHITALGLAQVRIDMFAELFFG